MKNKIFISDIIPPEEINKWQPGERILITSGTGSGKSYFIQNAIYDKCKESNKKCLLLSNRSLLRDQNLTLLDEKIDLITPLNYQLLETQILYGKNIYQLFAGYDYVVYDEIHHIFEGSNYSRNTDLLIEPIRNPLKDKVFIFITATPRTLLEYNNKYEYVYTIPTDYSYIDNIYFYTKTNTPEIIIEKISTSEKIIFFSSHAEEAYKLSEKYENAKFICSKGNKLKSKIDEDTVNQIITKECFDAQVLCTTTVLDNGINIKDKKLQHVILDLLDPTSFIQCLGRKRILDDEDKVNLYVRNYHGGMLHYSIMNLRAKLSTANEYYLLGKEKFQEANRKREFDSVVDNDFEINKAKLQNYMSQLGYLETMIQDPDGYKRYICNILDFDFNQIKDAEEFFEKMSMKEFLEQHINKKIYREDQDRFKELFFEKLFSPKKTDFRKRGIRSINAILEEDELSYRVITGRDRSKESRDRTYWMVINIDQYGQI